MKHEPKYKVTVQISNATKLRCLGSLPVTHLPYKIIGTITRLTGDRKRNNTGLLVQYANGNYAQLTAGGAIKSLEQKEVDYCLGIMKRDEALRCIE